MELIDLKGLRCPLPILRTKKVLARLESGDKLCVLTTDDNAPIDFKQFCDQTGHILLEQDTLDKYHRIVIEHK